MLIFLIYLQQYLCKKKNKKKVRLLKVIFFSILVLHTLPPIPSLLFYFTHIYIFFGKSRLLRLAILLPDRKNKRRLKLYLKERKDIFFIFFLIFLNFYYFKYCLGWWGPLWPAHPCCNLNCCFVFWYVVLWLLASLGYSTEFFFFFPQPIHLEFCSFSWEGLYLSETDFLVL